MKPEPRHLLWHRSLVEGGGLISVTTWFCGTLQMTTHKPELYFCSGVQNRRKKKKAVTKQLLDWNSSEFFFHHLLFFAILFLNSHENGGLERPRHLVPEPSSFQSVFPLLFMGQKQNHTNGPVGAAP